MKDVNINSNFIIRKDCHPIETIERIRKILRQLDLFPIETDWNILFGHFFSVRIEDYYLDKGKGVNGKGVSTELALASAYSEFMERMQNGLLFKKKYGLMDEVEFKHPDSIYLDKEVVFVENAHILNILFKWKENTNKNFQLPNKILCSPYYDLNNNKVSFLPDALIKAYTGSNGMAAGNTPKEALIQGICEIFERYSINYILSNEIEVPTIPLKAIEYLKIYPSIKLISDFGYSIVIKDCTLSGKIPVLGIVIFNKNRSKYKVSFGSDPVFEIALQRCITEIFQGMNIDLLEGASMSDIDFCNLFTDNVIVNNKAVSAIDHYKLMTVAKKLVISHSESVFPNAFAPEAHNNDKLFKFIIDKVKELDTNIYIRDVSFLGYPSFHIYIPNLSEFIDNDLTSLDLSLIRKVILNLKNATDSDIEKCINEIENHIFTKDTPHFLYAAKLNSQVIESIFASVELNDSSDLLSMTIELLMCLMCIKIESYKKAAHYLDLHLIIIKKSKLKLENLDYYQAVLLYLILKSEMKNDIVIKNTIVNIFGYSIYEEVFNDLTDIPNILKYYKLPSCGNCYTCEIHDECNYNRWKELTIKLNKEMSSTEIDQMNVSKLFN